jgi:hypothetical protein
MLNMVITSLCPPSEPTTPLRDLLGMFMWCLVLLLCLCAGKIVRGEIVQVGNHIRAACRRGKAQVHGVFGLADQLVDRSQTSSTSTSSLERTGL